MHPCPVGHRALIRGDRRWRRQQQRFKLYVIEICGQSPAHPGGAGPAEITAHPWLSPKLLAIARCGSSLANRSRKTSRIWRIDTLSAGISFPLLFGKRTRLLWVENCRRRGPLNPHIALIAITRIDDHLPPDWVIIFHRNP